MKITNTQKSILAVSELDADQTIVQIARKANLKVVTAQRALQRLVDLEVIAGRTAIVDISRLGLYEFGFSIKLGRCSRGARALFEEKLCSNARISWLAAVGGGFDYMLNIIAEAPHQVRAEMNWIAAQSPNGIIERELTVRTERLRFWRGYLRNGKSQGPHYHLGSKVEKIEISEIDRKILKTLNALKYQSHRELARISNIPIATFIRRLARLREQGVLLGFAYRLNLEKLSISQFRIFLKTTQTSAKICKQLVGLLSSSSISKLLTIGVGDWDFELEVDATDSNQVRSLVNKVEDELGENLLGVAVLPIFRHLKFISFPMI